MIFQKVKTREIYYFSMIFYVFFCNFIFFSQEDASDPEQEQDEAFMNMMNAINR